MGWERSVLILRRRAIKIVFILLISRCLSLVELAASHAKGSQSLGATKPPCIRLTFSKHPVLVPHAR